MKRIALILAILLMGGSLAGCEPEPQPCLGSGSGSTIATLEHREKRQC